MGKGWSTTLATPLSALGLYLVYHFQLMLAWSALGEIWAPLALLIPPAVLYVVYRRDRLRVQRRASYILLGGVYRVWTVAFAGGALILSWLADPAACLGALAAGAIAAWAFPKRGPVGLLAWGALAAASVAVAAREPWLGRDPLRAALGAALLLSVGWLFATDERRRVARFDFVALTLLAPTVFSIMAFYRAPAARPTAADPAVRFLYAADDSTSPPRVREGADLRFAAADCDGSLLLGGASSPGIERMAAGAASPPAAPIDSAKSGDNINVACGAGQALLYGRRDGRVVYRPAAGQERRAAFDQPVLKAEADWGDGIAFVMGRTDLLAVLRLPSLSVAAQRRSGVNIDILYAPQLRTLFRSTLLRGVEAMTPASLTVQGLYPMPTSVGGALAYDPDHDRLFVSDWLGATLHVVDPRDLTAVVRVKAPRGVRSLVYDRRRELLLAASYFTGEALAYRPYVGGPPLRLAVGRRVRGLTLDGGRCLGVSAAGVFAVDLDQLASRFGS
jgi:hypothetical protein